MAYTQDEKPSGLSTLTSLDSNDTVIVGDTSDTSETVKTITWTNLQSAITTLVEGLSSYFNVTSDDSDAITEGATNLFLTTSERSKLTNIEALADVTDEANVTDALDGATLTAATIATDDKVLIQDTDGSDVLKTVTTQAVADLYSVTESDVTTHEAALTITESQISDLGSYITSSSTESLTNKTIDGDNNTISNLDLGNEVDWAAADDVTTASAFTSGDKVLVFEAGVGMRKVDYDDLPAGGGSGINNVVEDTTPQLGGQLDVNGNALGDGTLELLKFSETASAVNELTVTNAATGNGPTLSASGDDTNIDLVLEAKGSGVVKINTDTILTDADKTGADAGVVSGTAGTSGNLAQWNVDGDLVDAGFAVTTGTPGKGSILVGDGTSDYDEVTAGTNDQVIVYDSAQGNGVKAVDLDAGINFVIDGGGSAITTGIKGDVEIPFDCTIEQVTMLADQTGSIVVDLWVDTYANFPPTDADSITASAVPTISSATKDQDATLTGWTTALTQGDILRYNVDSASTVTRCTVALRVRRNF